MANEFEVSDIIPASPEEIYDAWLDSETHGAMTGGEADVSNVVGGIFTAWDGYITGKNLELKKPVLIVQEWRTAEFGESEPDSRIEVRLEKVDGGTCVTIKHSHLPSHGMQYRQGWIDNYFTPMKEYF